MVENVKDLGLIASELASKSTYVVVNVNESADKTSTYYAKASHCLFIDYDDGCGRYKLNYDDYHFYLIRISYLRHVTTVMYHSTYVVGS